MSLKCLFPYKPWSHNFIIECSKLHKLRTLKYNFRVNPVVLYNTYRCNSLKSFLNSSVRPRGWFLTEAEANLLNFGRGRSQPRNGLVLLTETEAEGKMTILGQTEAEDFSIKIWFSTEAEVINLILAEANRGMVRFSWPRPRPRANRQYSVKVLGRARVLGRAQVNSNYSHKRWHFTPVYTQECLTTKNYSLGFRILIT